MKLRIGMDFDGVMSKFRESHALWLQQNGYPHAIVENCTNTWDYYRGWGMTDDEFLQTYHDGVAAGFILRLDEPYAETLDFVRRNYAEGHEIHIITDRRVGPPGLSSQHTAAWLGEHGVPFNSLTISADKTNPKTDIYFDDKPENIEDISRSGGWGVLVDRPWNSGYTLYDKGLANVFRAYSVKDMQEFVEYRLEYMENHYERT